MSSVGSVIRSVYAAPMFGVEKIWAKLVNTYAQCDLPSRSARLRLVSQFTVYALSFQLNLCFSFRDFL